MAILWRKSLETGLGEIDDQHQEIFRRANKLIEVNKSDLGREGGYEEARKLLEFLKDYMVEHLREEEELQQKYDYPDYQRHKKLHDNLIDKTDELIEQFATDEDKLSDLVDLNRFVLNWLKDHISREDKKLVKYINKQK